MTRFFAPLSILLLGACASPAAQQQADPAALRDAQLQAQVDRMQAQVELLLQQQMQEASFGATIIPPIRVNTPNELAEQELRQQKEMIDALLALALEAHQNQASPLIDVQLPTLIETDFGPGFVSVTPEITIGKVEGDTITLNVATTNPIGGPTVHHYEIKKVDGVWVGSFVGSTEYL